MKNRIETFEYERKMEHDKWRREIPFLTFPSDWEIQITPPFAGAVVRFQVKKRNANISIYLDCYDHLGFVGQPYWEIYPYEGDTFRCLMNETDRLIEAITKSIEEQII